MRHPLSAAILCVAVALALAWALIERPAPPVDLPELAAAALAASGVDHPVTAVLLDWRALDTLLEVAVLLVAVLVARALRQAQPDSPDRMGLENPLLHGVMGGLLPLMLLVAGYLLWAGADRPGGAFQAGAVLAAAGVLLRLAGVALPGRSAPGWLRAGLALGTAVFVAVGTLALPMGLPWLAYPPELAGGLILVVEVALTLSIALALLSLFRLAPPYPDKLDEGAEDGAPRSDGTQGGARQ